MERLSSEDPPLSFLMQVENQPCVWCGGAFGTYVAEEPLLVVVASSCMCNERCTGQMKLGCHKASCSKCILRPCNADNDNLCEPYGFALNDKSGAFHTYFSAACEVQIRQPPAARAVACCETRSAMLL